jgi:large subunit ribosomal protein L29
VTQTSKNKAAEYAGKSVDELNTLEGELRTALFKGRIQNHTNQLDSTAKLRGLRRDIARIKTVLRQRELETAPSENTGKDTQS